MQKKKYLIALSFLLLFFCRPVVHGQPNVSELLELGDSLYRSHQYLSAFEKYETIYSRKRCSPQMLLKMASVQEGVGDHARTLYFLMQHYWLTYDVRVRDKILSIAEAQSLRGYVFEDGDYFMRIWFRYRSILMAIIFSVCLVFFVGIFYLRSAKKRRRKIALYLFCWTLCGFSLLFWDTLFRQEYGISLQNALVLEAPSSAAAQLDNLSVGERAMIEERDVIWTKIKWQTTKGYQQGYVRTKSLLFFG